MKKILISFTLLVTLMFSGCGIFQQYANLKPLDKAKVSVETFSSWYESTHLELEKQLKEGDAEKVAFIKEKISPKMNELRPLIVKYDKLVLLWQETNTQPDGISGLVTEIQKIVLGVIEALQ